jgi:hypothetical protein
MSALVAILEVAINPNALHHVPVLWVLSNTLSK